MKTTEFQKGQSVVVTTKSGKVEGIIKSVDTNLCTFDIEYSIDYLKDGKTLTIIGVPTKAIEVVEQTDSLNHNEKKVLECMIENTIDNGGFILDELSCFGEFTINQLKGYASSLQKKGLVEMYGRDSYNDGRAILK